jgi:hypothetical protein
MSDIGPSILGATEENADKILLSSCFDVLDGPVVVCYATGRVEYAHRIESPSRVSSDFD